MKKIDEKEMMSVCGGSWIWTLGKIAAVVFGTSFITGIIDGFVRPLKCR